MSPAERERFDTLLDEVVAALPPGIVGLLEEKPLVVEDHPDPELLAELGIPAECRNEICGLHSGPMLTERGADGGPEDIAVIHLFRDGVLEAAGGWEAWEDQEQVHGGEASVIEQIRITVLHEIGHHFGLDEDDLERLGYA
ncbi:MAG: metallopeptidase family protein [Phycisphaerales bacterium]|nr:metallopeptidase family protein [Phycisphaerales bacterium]